MTYPRSATLIHLFSQKLKYLSITERLSELSHTPTNTEILKLAIGQNSSNPKNLVMGQIELSRVKSFPGYTARVR